LGEQKKKKGFVGAAVNSHKDGLEERPTSHPEGKYRVHQVSKLEKAAYCIQGAHLFARMKGGEIRSVSRSGTLKGVLYQLPMAKRGVMLQVSVKDQSKEEGKNGRGDSVIVHGAAIAQKIFPSSVRRRKRERRRARFLLSGGKNQAESDSRRVIVILRRQSLKKFSERWRSARNVSW